ncbi:MAG: OmpH family outer membrane protein [Bacteroidetes bacterium]|nr:OmpH family outer membrane protein [Bacteroidota bacterium]
MMRYLIVSCFLVLASFGANAQIVKADSTHAPAVVFVNSDTLLTNYDYFKAVRAKLQTLSQSAQNELATRDKAFQAEVASYQKRVNSLTPMQKAATEKKLAKEQQTLQEMSQNTAKQLQEMEADENTKLYERIAAYLKTYTKTKGYKIVLTYSKTNPNMLYGDDSLDITKEVLAGLNAEYKAATGK